MTLLHGILVQDYNLGKEDFKILVYSLYADLSYLIGSLHNNYIWDTLINKSITGEWVVDEMVYKPKNLVNWFPNKVLWPSDVLTYGFKDGQSKSMNGMAILNGPQEQHKAYNHLECQTWP